MRGSCSATRCGPVCAESSRAGSASANSMPLPSSTAKTLAKRVIDAIDQRRRGAEVSLEMHGFESQRKFAGNFKADLLDARKKLGIGIAEEVDGLHGIADDEAGAPLALGPGSDKVREQLMLAAAGVLKLVDQQMANAVGDGDRSVSWAARLRLSAHLARAAQPRCSPRPQPLRKPPPTRPQRLAQQCKTSAHNLPVFFGIVRRRQLTNRGERRFESRNSREACNQIEESCFFGFALLGKSVTDIDLLAKAAVAGE